MKLPDPDTIPIDTPPETPAEIPGPPTPPPIDRTCRVAGDGDELTRLRNENAQLRNDITAAVGALELLRGFSDRYGKATKTTVGMVRVGVRVVP